MQVGIEKKTQEMGMKKNPTPDEEDDMVRFYLCLLFNYFLFTNTHCNIWEGLLRYIEEIDDLPNIDWVCIIVKCTLEKYCSLLSTCVWKGIREHEASVYLRGCPTVLQVIPDPLKLPITSCVITSNWQMY